MAPEQPPQLMVMLNSYVCGSAIVICKVGGGKLFVCCRDGGQGCWENEERFVEIFWYRGGMLSVL